MQLWKFWEFQKIPSGLSSTICLRHTLPQAEFSEARNDRGPAAQALLFIVEGAELNFYSYFASYSEQSAEYSGVVEGFFP